MPNETDKLLHTVDGAAAILSLSVKTVQRLIGKKELTARRIGRRVMIPHVELVKLSRRDVLVI